MTDRPIIFSGPMVRALLEGRKTQTRRLLRAQPPSECSIRYMLGNESWLPAEQRKPLVHHWEAWRGPLFEARPAKALAGGFTAKMPCKPGDRLWVREACAPRLTSAGRPDPNPRYVKYRADHEGGPSDPNDWHTWPERWRPSIHMPRWASRLTLTVTDVRVQRLQDISRDDVIAEGITERDGAPIEDVWAGWHEPYAALWDSLHGNGSWDANPWIVAVTFTVAHGNIDSSPLVPMTPNLRCGDRRSGFVL